MKIITITRIIVVLSMIFAATGCDSLMKNYPFETDPDQLKSRTILDYFENSNDQSRTTYCAAVRHAGLVDAVTAGNVTCVVPNNSAWTPFLNSIGVSTVEEADPDVIRAILQYLIFPGDYRALTMTPDENVEVESLSGDPIWIMRSPSQYDKYRMVINGGGVSSSADVPVRQQDFLFMNNVVGQVVTELVTYRPLVPVTEGKPADLDDSEAKRDVLYITDDCHIYMANSGTGNYDNNQAMALVSNRGNLTERVGLFKTKLKPVDFAEDIIRAVFYARVAFVASYVGDATCQIDFHSLGDVSWIESTATYASMAGGRVYPLATSAYLASATFIVPGSCSSESMCQTMFREEPTFVRWDITGHILNAYADAGENSDTELAFALYDNSPGRFDAGTIIRLCTKDYIHSIVPTFLSYITLQGPLPSKMRLRNNKAVGSLDGKATLTPETSFAMEGPAVSDGYDYSEHNIVYMLKSLPKQGILTKYSIPMKRNDKFTQAEMSAGVIRYLKTGSGQDSFLISATDYLGGMYYTDATNTMSKITVNIN